MAKKLATYVHVVERDDEGNTTNQGVFGPEDDLSKPENAWVEKAITNPDVWQEAGDEPDKAADAPAAKSRTAPKPPGR